MSWLQTCAEVREMIRKAKHTEQPAHVWDDSHYNDHDHQIQYMDADEVNDFYGSGANEHIQYTFGTWPSHESPEVEA